MIYFVRHGETDWNKERKVQGRADIALNEKGILQAYDARKELLDKPIDLIICSTLKRARQTADIINEGRNIEIIYDERILERDFGEFEGLFKDEFDYHSYWNYNKNCKYEKAENIQVFFKRVYGFMNYVTETYKDKIILVSSHAGVSIAANAKSKGIPEDGNVLEMVLGNCKIAEYNI